MRHKACYLLAMIQTRLSLAGFSAGVVALLLAPYAGAAEPKAVELDYQIWTGGLQAMSLETRMLRGQDRYQVDIKLESAGMIGRMFPFKLSARSQGKTKAGGGEGLRPDVYDVRSTWRDQDRVVAIRYEDGTRPVVKVEPPAEDDNRDPVPQEQIAGTIDPMSAVLVLLEQTAAEGRCQGEVQVFDGRRRYDMVVRHVGPAEVAESSYSPYAGPAVECRAGMKRISGFWNTRKAKEHNYDELRIFLAPILDNVPPLPVRLVAKNDYFSIIIHMVDARLSDGVQPAGVDF
ncbi:MAG: DUF3108 domain-containing protein [Kiloniellales bacterium]|nr:DUF3108 domain-containing protein [Kiloniellales bacterium]